MQPYFVGLDVHKQVIAFCAKTAEGGIVAEGTIPATRSALDEWGPYGTAAVARSHGGDDVQSLDLLASETVCR